MWNDTFKLALRMLDYEKEIKDYNEKSFFKRLISKAPKAPSNKNWKELCTQYMNEFNASHQDMPDEIRFNWQSEPDNPNQKAYPLISFWTYSEGCYFVTRIAFTDKGSIEEWGCPYPYSECGLTGRLTDYNHHDKDVEYQKFDQLIEEIKKAIYLVSSNRFRFLVISLSNFRRIVCEDSSSFY